MNRHIDGQIISYVNLAFNDYVKQMAFDDFVKDKSGLLKEIRHYRFGIEEKGDLLYVEIELNHELLKREHNLAFKGGGARYEIDKKGFKIKDRILYK